MKKNIKLLISIFFLLTCNSCYFETSVPEDGSEKQRGFIQVFIDPDSLDFIRSDKLSSGTKSLIFNIEGEELNRKEIEEIQNKYGDTVFNRRMVMIGISALATEFSLIDIKSNTIQQWTAADRFDHHLQMTFAHQPLLQQTEMTVKQRLREHLPPRASIAQQLRHFHGHFGRA